MIPIVIQVSPGELVDRISILRLKIEHQNDESKRAKLQRELDALTAVVNRLLLPPKARALCDELASINASLWEAEDRIRMYIQNADLDARVAEAALLICRENDRRIAVRQSINEVFADDHLDQKTYTTCRS